VCVPHKAGIAVGLDQGGQIDRRLDRQSDELVGFANDEVVEQ